VFFSSGPFWLFFLSAAILYHLFPAKLRWAVLLAASLAFYGHWRIEALLLLLVHVAWIQVLARYMDGLPSGSRRRRVVAWVAAGGPLLSLVVLKYGRMVLESVAPLFSGGGAARPFGTWTLLVPIGISFYTFKMVSYVIEVYRGRMPAERNPGILALYVSFFPQVLAGPIDRPNDLIPQLRRPRNINPDDLADGVRRIVWGLFKKLAVADRLAYFVAFVFDSPAGQGWNLVFAAYLFAFQIYCDFSGYSDIAIGLSRLLGIDSAENFDRPYLSRSVSQFWAKWHMSLSRWLRDYIFLPLSYGVMRRIRADKVMGIGTETWGYGAAIMVTMSLCGLWHGPSWHFVFWGALFGVYLVVSVATRKVRRRLVRRTGLNGHPRWRGALAVFTTFHLVAFAWIFFRSASLERALFYIGQFEPKFNGLGVPHLVFSAALVILFLVLEAFEARRSGWPWVRRIPMPVRLAAAALFVGLIAILAVNSANEFIYVQF
jgi:alginate O-acetyltransferase complex protein AlgI